MSKALKILKKNLRDARQLRIADRFTFQEHKKRRPRDKGILYSFLRLRCENSRALVQQCKLKIIWEKRTEQ